MSEWYKRLRSLPLKTPNDYQNQYQKDYSRLLHSESFRRLQGKMQVFPINMGDFHRTRLTHSLEVCQVGKSILWQLKHKYRNNKELLSWLPAEILLDTICLGHDLGHPPFGHGGEDILNQLMINSGGFEANAQTIRLVSKLEKYSLNSGMNLTRRALLGLIKYPVLYSDCLIDDATLPPKCIYDADKPILNFITETFSEADREKFCSIKNNRAQYKALDTSIMELADDIAYSTHDLEDALIMQVIDKSIWLKAVRNSDKKLLEIPLVSEIFAEIFIDQSSYKLKAAIAKLINFFVTSISINNNQNFEHPLLHYQAELSANAKLVLKFLRKLIFDNIINSPMSIQKIHQGHKIIKDLFYFFNDNPDKMPDNTHDRFENSENKKRIVCDYIAGMTDNYAVKLHKELIAVTT